MQGCTLFKRFEKIPLPFGKPSPNFTIANKKMRMILPQKKKPNLNTTNNLTYSFLKDKIQCKHNVFYLHQCFQ